MTMSFDAPPMVASDERAGSLARRMLSGSAAASLYAYRLQETLPFLAHGMTPDGSLVVAALPTGTLAATAPGFAVDVRLDLIKQAPDPSVSITAASVHLLGTLAWASDAETAARLADGGLPPRVAAMLEVPGARLGFIEAERTLLHDMEGATVLAPEAMRYGLPAIEDEHAAFDLVAQLDQSTLKDLCWAVMVGAVPGRVVSKAPLPAVCPHTSGRVFCVDVDAAGLTVMMVAREETLIVHARFDAPVASQRELGSRLALLVERSAP